jgi:hypothetical protein
MFKYWRLHVSIFDPVFIVSLIIMPKLILKTFNYSKIYFANKYIVQFKERN